MVQKHVKKMEGIPLQILNQMVSGYWKQASGCCITFSPVCCIITLPLLVAPPPPNKCCSCYTPTHPLSAFRSGISRCQCLETTLFFRCGISRHAIFNAVDLYCLSIKTALGSKTFFVALRLSSPILNNWNWRDLLARLKLFYNLKGTSWTIWQCIAISGGCGKDWGAALSKADCSSHLAGDQL